MTSTPKTTGTAPPLSSAPAAPRSRRYLWPLYAQLLKRSNLPILIGPFRGEVGFETLYWIPWLLRQRKTLGLDPNRLFPISRGGAAAWYGCPQGLELYAMRDPKDVRIENRRQQQQTGRLKQDHVTRFDRDVLHDAAASLGVKQYLTIHPSWMYQDLEPYWAAEKGLNWLFRRVLYDMPAAAPTLPDGLVLPKQFVAVRFYHRTTWPASENTAVVAREVIKQLAQQQPVILLNSGLHVDDHLDFIPKTRPENVALLSDLVPMTPETNLAVQSAVLARAHGFAGTYGGFAQLALRFGKSSVSFYQDWGGTMIAHKHLADFIATQRGITTQVQRLTDVPLLRNVLPSLEIMTGPTRRSPLADEPVPA